MIYLPVNTANLKFIICSRRIRRAEEEFKYNRRNHRAFVSRYRSAKDFEASI